jgi:hypothetical protein
MKAGVRVEAVLSSPIRPVIYEGNVELYLHEQHRLAHVRSNEALESRFRTVLWRQRTPGSLTFE